MFACPCLLHCACGFHLQRDASRGRYLSDVRQGASACTEMGRGARGGKELHHQWKVRTHEATFTPVLVTSHDVEKMHTHAHTHTHTHMLMHVHMASPDMHIPSHMYVYIRAPLRCLCQHLFSPHKACVDGCCEMMQHEAELRRREVFSRGRAAAERSSHAGAVAVASLLSRLFLAHKHMAQACHVHAHPIPCHVRTSHQHQHWACCTDMRRQASLCVCASLHPRDLVCCCSPP